MAKDRLAPVRGILKKLTTPLLPDDYSALLNPLWSTRELRGRIVSATREGEVVHLEIETGWGVPTTFEAGQYIGLGVLLDGRYTWRSYSLTNTPDTNGKTMSITVRAVEKGKLSNHLVGTVTSGTVIRLLAPAGDFHLSNPVPKKLAFIAAGTGITPVIAMMRTMERRGELEQSDVTLYHCARTQDGLLFGPELEAMAANHQRFTYIPRITSVQGRLSTQELPISSDVVVYACGPAKMLDELENWARENGIDIKTERFLLDRSGTSAQGGTITFGPKGQVAADGATTILEAAESQGIQVPFGCRMGICHTCTRPLVDGEAMNLRTGEAYEKGARIRTCVSVACGDVEIDV